MVKWPELSTAADRLARMINKAYLLGSVNLEGLRQLAGEKLSESSEKVTGQLELFLKKNMAGRTKGSQRVLWTRLGGSATKTESSQLRLRSMATTIFQARSPIVACAIGVVAAALGVALLINTGTGLLAGFLMLFAGWSIIASICQSLVRISEEGISFVTFRGRQQWLWSEITEAHLSGTGTIPGIAVYRGSVHVTLGRSQFPDLGAVARYIEKHVPPDAVRSSWAAD